jgi:hypothetical protein
VRVESEAANESFPPLQGGFQGEGQGGDGVGGAHSVTASSMCRSRTWNACSLGSDIVCGCFRVQSNASCTSAGTLSSGSRKIRQHLRARCKNRLRTARICAANPQSERPQVNERHLQRMPRMPGFGCRTSDRSVGIYASFGKNSRQACFPGSMAPAMTMQRGADAFSLAILICTERVVIWFDASSIWLGPALQQRYSPGV